MVGSHGLGKYLNDFDENREITLVNPIGANQNELESLVCLKYCNSVHLQCVIFENTTK